MHTFIHMHTFITLNTTCIHAFHYTLAYSLAYYAYMHFHILFYMCMGIIMYVCHPTCSHAIFILYSSCYAHKDIKWLRKEAKSKTWKSYYSGSRVGQFQGLPWAAILEKYRRNWAKFPLWKLCPYVLAFHRHKNQLNQSCRTQYMNFWTQTAQSVQTRQCTWPVLCVHFGPENLRIWQRLLFNICASAY